MNATAGTRVRPVRKPFAGAEAGKPESKAMKQNTNSTLETVRVLHEDELDRVIGGVAACQVWVSPMAIHGFNPQPDPPAFQVVVLAGPQL